MVLNLELSFDIRDLKDLKDLRDPPISIRNKTFQTLFITERFPDVSHHFILKVGINVGTIAGGGTDLLHQQEPLLTGLGIYPLEFNAGHSLDPLVSLHYDSHLCGGVPHLRVNEESNVLQGISTT